MSEILFDDGQSIRKVRVQRQGRKFLVKIDDNEEDVIVEAQRRGQGRLQLRYGNSPSLYKCVLAKEGTDRFIFVGGRIYKLQKVEKKVAIKKEDEELIDFDLTSPMPGKIVKILVKVGDEVGAKDELLIVEAMKMENRILAPYAGRVEAIHFVVGDQVRQGDVLLDLIPQESSETATQQNETSNETLI
ncbi:MAG: biotin/lipoyl-binding protein [Candidatus Heimdallarchaeota archaeon]|nr:MAG: biotin/lipoyl-binding protein [Candidatus Heimdallarchaeota archaeon]